MIYIFDTFDTKNTFLIRACNLRMGDFFLLMGTIYKVIKITNSHIHYKAASSKNGFLTGHRNMFGIKSQQKVELLNLNKIDK